MAMIPEMETRCNGLPGNACPRSNNMPTATQQLLHNRDFVSDAEVKNIFQD